MVFAKLPAASELPVAKHGARSAPQREGASIGCTTRNSFPYRAWLQERMAFESAMDDAEMMTYRSQRTTHVIQRESESATGIRSDTQFFLAHFQNAFAGLLRLRDK